MWILDRFFTFLIIQRSAFCMIYCYSLSEGVLTILDLWPGSIRIRSASGIFGVFAEVLAGRATGTQITFPRHCKGLTSWDILYDIWSVNIVQYCSTLHRHAKVGKEKCVRSAGSRPKVFLNSLAERVECEGWDSWRGEQQAPSPPASGVWADP